jgi:hypothetical protein
MVNEKCSDNPENYDDFESFDRIIGMNIKNFFIPSGSQRKRLVYFMQAAGLKTCRTTAYLRSNSGEHRRVNCNQFCMSVKFQRRAFLLNHASRVSMEVNRIS